VDQREYSSSPMMGHPASEEGGGGTGLVPLSNCPTRWVADSTRLLVIRIDGTVNKRRNPTTRHAAARPVLPPSTPWSFTKMGRSAMARIAPHTKSWMKGRTT
jgi:hypothetical protein